MLPWLSLLPLTDRLSSSPAPRLASAPTWPASWPTAATTSRSSPAAASASRSSPTSCARPTTSTSRSRPATSAAPPPGAALIKKLQEGEREVVGVCNNAGFGNLGNLLDNDLEKETEVVRLNVEAVHQITGAFLPRMVEQGAGAVLNVASTAAFQPLPGFATYAASKAFVHSFSEAVHSD